MLEQVSQALCWQPQHSSSLACVKHVDDIDAEISLQPLHIAVGAVEHLHNFWVVENTPQGVADLPLERDSVNNEVFLPRADLHQACEALITTVVMVLQVDSNFFAGLQFTFQVTQLFLRIDEGERRLI